MTVTTDSATNFDREPTKLQQFFVDLREEYAAYDGPVSDITLADMGAIVRENRDGH